VEDFNYSNMLENTSVSKREMKEREREREREREGRMFDGVFH